MGRRVWRSGAYIACAVSFWVAAALWCALSTTEMAPGDPTGWFLCAGCAVLAGRATLLRVVLTDGEVRIHGWLRNRRVPASDVLRVNVVAYAGMWFRGSPSKQVMTLQLVMVDDRVIEVPGVLGLAATKHLRRVAKEISHAIRPQDQPATPDRAPRHRRLEDVG